MTGFAAIDFETANWSRSSACAVGVAVVEDDRVVATREWLMRPPEGHDHFEPFHTRLHGISAEAVSSQPRFAAALPEILDFVDGRIIVAHNANFDIGVLRFACLASDLQWPTLSYACTLALARSSLKLLSYRLPFCAEALGVPLGNHHRALDDATAAAGVALALMRSSNAGDLVQLLEARQMRFGQLRETSWQSCREHWKDPRGSLDRVRLRNPDADPAHPLYGKRVTITGALPNLMTRNQAFEILAEIGAEAQDNVRKDTDVLVVADLDPTRLRPGTNLSGKMRRAEELQEGGQQIEIMAGFDFLAVLLD